LSVAVLSNVNIKPLKRFLEGFFSEIYFGGYNQYPFEFLNESSRLNNHKFDVILLFLDGDEYLKSYTDKLVTLRDIAGQIDVDIKQLFAMINVFLSKDKNKNCLFVVNTLTINPNTFNTFLEKNTDYSFQEIKDFINQRIVKFKKCFNNVLILDWASIVNFYGYSNLYDSRFWYLGKIKYNNMAFEALSLNLKQLMGAYKGETKKVLALDLDNTLWMGIIGEGGIRLSEEGPEKSYRDFQKLIKSLKDIGIILAIVSKNNFDDVKEVFESHPLMILKLDDFVSTRINWDDKATNIRELANELNLGLDSFVFIDDNPMERELVKTYLPEVMVPEFPQEPADLPDWFVKEVVYNYFPRAYITEEDSKKTLQYKSNIQRKKIKKSLDINSFIESLDIKTKLYVDDKRFIERTAQQTQKTNQFNLTTKRYTNADVQQFVISDKYLVFNLEYEDKFGNEGIVATAIVEVDDEKATIDVFLMSCRVIGRKIESGFLNDIVNYISRMNRNIKSIFAEYVPTKKNRLTKSFYENKSFDIDEVYKNGGKMYKLDLANKNK